MIYRSWNYDDILTVAEMEKRCFSEESWTFQMFASSFEQPGFFCELCEAEYDGQKKLAAYGCVQCVEDTADLMTIAVAPEYRGRGLGRVMLRRLVGGARRRGAKKLFLEVRVSNDVAKRLYLNEGFERISVRKKYYPDGEDAVVMVKEL